jgi:spore germination cell wall hydrolase CwlJ-like protein
MMTYTKQSYAALLLLIWAAALVLTVNYLDIEYSGHKPEVLEINLDSLSDGETLPAEETLLPPKLYHKKPAVKVEPQREEIKVATHEVIFITEREKTCLIRNVFYESGSEPYLGKIAVAQVTWNRVKYGQWGQDICRVVYAPGQFSWTVETHKRNSRIGGPGWEDTIQAVEDFINGTRVARLENSMFFHASYVKPNWHKWADRIKQIGNHIFYELK